MSRQIWGFTFDVPLHDSECFSCDNVTRIDGKPKKSVNFDFLSFFEYEDLDIRLCDCIVRGFLSLSKEKYIPRSMLNSSNIEGCKK